MPTDDLDWDVYNEPDYDARPSGGRPKRADPGYDLGPVEIIYETDNALLVRGEGLSSDPFGLKDKNEESWVPKSQIHNSSELQHDSGRGAKGRMVVSTWLAQKRGLV